MEKQCSRLVVDHTRAMFGLLKEPRIVIGVALMIAGTMIGGLVMQRANARVSVWQLDHAVAAGTVLEPEDVHLAEVAGDVTAYVDAGTVVSGKELAVPLGAGAFIPVDAFADSAPVFDTVMVPTEALHLPEDLRRGELVDVWVSTTEPSTTDCVLKAARVLRTVRSDIGGSRGVELAVPPTLTAQLIAAMHRGALDLVRVSG